MNPPQDDSHAPLDLHSGPGNSTQRNGLTPPWTLQNDWRTISSTDFDGPRLRRGQPYNTVFEFDQKPPGRQRDALQWQLACR